MNLFESCKMNSSDVNLSLETITKADIDAVHAVICQCYPDVENRQALFESFNLKNGLLMQNCIWCYKITQADVCIGVVTLVYLGKEAMLIQNLALTESGHNTEIFERLIQKHPEVMCWNILFHNQEPNQIEVITEDFGGRRKQFCEENGFAFYTPSRGDHFIKLMKPHDEIYQSDRYRFALLDNSMDGVAFRFFGIDGLDFYDGRLTRCRLTDVNASQMTVYDTDMSYAQFFCVLFANSEFRHIDFSQSKISDSSFKNCALTNCDLEGMTIDGISVEEALALYKNKNIQI